MKKTISIAVQNGTTATQPIQLLIAPTDFSSINALTQYRWNVTSQSLVHLTAVSITYTLNGTSTTATATITDNSVNGIINALNSLGVGTFWSTTSGGSTFINTYNDFVTYSNLEIKNLANIQINVTVIAFTNLIFTVTQSAPNQISWDWGDGTQQVFNVANPTPSHVYPVGGSYTINIIFASPGLLLTFIGGSDTDQADIVTNDFTSLQILRFENGNLTSFDASNLSNSSALTFLALDNNLLTSFNPSPLTNTLQTLWLHGNNMSSFITTSIPQAITFLTLHANRLSVSIVNSVLIALDAAGQLNGQVNTSSQTPAAPPSGAGITAKNNLIGKGWTVTTD